MIDHTQLEAKIRKLVAELIPNETHQQHQSNRTRAYRFHDENEMTHHIAQNLELLEPGLRLYTESGERGIEFPCAIRNWGRQGSMDILAIDRNGGLVVIECKARYGTALALGQVLGYIAWIRHYMFKAAPTPTPDQLAQDPQAFIPTSPTDTSHAPEMDWGFPIPIRGFIVCKKATPMLRLATREAVHADLTLFEYTDSLHFIKLES